MLVSTFGAQDIDPARSSARGVKLLRSYLAYCDSGGSDLGRAAVEVPELNPFEMSVRDALQARGLDLVPQHGVSGYRIDFAAVHPDRPGEFALAIECDGASYHAHPTARDRDRLRQEHLERLGWRFHRIWSTDWFNNKDAEVTRAVAAYEAALVDDAGTSESHELVVATVTHPVATPTAARGPRPSFQAGLAVDAYDQSTLIRVAKWVRSDGLLRTEDELLDEIMGVLGFKRRGKKIVAALSQAIDRTRG